MYVILSDYRLWNLYLIEKFSVGILQNLIYLSHLSSYRSTCSWRFQTKQELWDYIRSSLHALHRVHLRHKCLKPVSADLVPKQVAVIKFQGTISAKSINISGMQLLN